MRKRKILRVGLIVLVSVVVLIVALIVYVRAVAIVHPPEISDQSSLDLERKQVSEDFFTIGNNWFRKSESGLYELYVEGTPFERGVINGKLTKELVQHQEVVFNEQLHQLVPSEFYINFLKYFIGWFNRDLENYVTEEYKQEIFGVSHAASHDFDDIASPYQRILNYHAAHDMGHALQNMALVGCTAFGVWGDRSADSTLTIGRNFDFFVGDEFAEQKIIAFYNPSKGYKFMMVTWAGMTGVLSGMNMEGLSVTINAAKSEIPSASATPVSLVAREILQYASTIDEAYAIAAKRKMFVSESFLIGSAKDNRAAIIEKSIDGIDMYDPNGNQIVCTNHFQGKTLGATQLNLDHIKTSASPYRYERVGELLGREEKISVSDVVGILRNQLGKRDSNIGLGNEKSVNQLVAHHGIVFQPAKKLVWVSTAPWQLGKFVCYDLNKIFGSRLTENREIQDTTKTIPADTFLLKKQYRDYVKFARYRFPFEPRTDMQPDSLVKWNPDSYHAYMLAGDAYFDKDDYATAAQYYEIGLTKEIATIQEREHMEKNLQRCKEKL
jgi:isopenicillin-N N-acyltransferase like protein